MASSLFQKQARNLTQAEKNKLQNIIGMAKGTPQQNLMGMLGGNLANILGGKDPKSAFYSKCEQMGINPDDVLSMLK